MYVTVDFIRIGWIKLWATRRKRELQNEKFLGEVVEFCSAVSEKKSKMSQPIRGHGGHLVFPIGRKNTNSVKKNKILFPVKFRWIRLIDYLNIFYFNFSMKRDSLVSEKSKMSQPIRGQGRHLVLPIGSEKHKLGRGHWDLASCNNSRKSWSNWTKVEFVLHQDKYLYKTSSK